MAEQNKIRILLVDDHEIMRIGLKLLVNSWPEVDLVGEAVDGVEAQTLAKELDPDVILMDVEMPRVDGITASMNIRAFNQEVRIIILTSQSKIVDIKRALAAGVNGYCLKDVDDSRLKRAILSVLDGDIWLDARVSKELLSFSKKPTTNQISSGSGLEIDQSKIVKNFPFEPLSERELEVLELLVKGLTNKEIGVNLHISRDTVKTHIRHIMEKLVAKDRTDAAVKAVKHNLVQ